MKPKLLIEDVTEYANPKDIEDGLVKLEHVHIFDDDIRVHCCSLTPSLECEFLYVAYEFKDDTSEDDRQRIYDDNDSYMGTDFGYFDTNWKHIIDLDDQSDWEDWEECVEYYQCNCCY